MAGGESSIEWTERTLNVWTGCSKVSPGCANCYIERQPPLRVAGRRFVRGRTTETRPEFAADPDQTLRFHLERLDPVVRRRKPTVYFVNSMSDTFHEDVPDQYIARLWAAMACAPQHTFQVLTKRPERMRALLARPDWPQMVAEQVWAQESPRDTAWHRTKLARYRGDGLVLPHVWLGVTVENRSFAWRADVLRQTPAAVRFLSCEPLLGPLVARWVPEDGDYGQVHGGEWVWPDGKTEPEPLDLTGIDWVIAGGESGPGARPCRVEWLRDLRDACERESLSRMGGPGPYVGELGELPTLAARPCLFFLKQLGGHPDKRGGDEALLDGQLHHAMPAARVGDGLGG